MDWKTMLAYITGSVDQELLLGNEYLVAENRILRNQIQGRLRLTDGERRTLAEIGKQLGKRALEEVASIEAHPLRGEVTSSRPEALCHPSSSRKESPGQGESIVVPGQRTEASG